MLSSLCVSQCPFSAPLPVHVTVPLSKVDGEAERFVEVVVVVVVLSLVGAVVVVVVAPELPVFPVAPVVLAPLVSGAAGDEPSTPKVNAVAPRTVIVARPRPRNARPPERRLPEGAFRSRRVRRAFRKFENAPI
jgi:hypothetical protein